MYRHVLIGVVALLGANVAWGQTRFVINDRTSDAMWTLHDMNANGLIDEPGELWRWFDATNAAGTLGPSNPTCLAIDRSGRVIMGDQGNAVIYSFRDRNSDGDALDVDESLVIVDASNASGVSFAFPTGVAFGPDKTPYVVNAGNSFGPDGIFALHDLNGDGDCQDPDEIVPYVGEPVFGAGNGPYSPQEIVIDAVGVGYLHDSASGTRGVYRFEDLDHDGRADGPGEFNAYFDGSNASGVGVSSGFGLDPDVARPGSLYLQQTATGSMDQLIRLTDTNGDLDAQDAGDGEVVFQTNESGFTSIDLLSRTDGSVFITSNSSTGGYKVVVLTDNDGDGHFMSPGERADFFANSGGLVRALRQIATLPLYERGDMNCDGAFNGADIDQFFLALGDPTAYELTFPDCDMMNGDMNRDGAVNGADIDVFYGCLGAGGCP